MRGVVTIRKRREGWREGEGVKDARVPPSWTVSRTKIHPKSLSDPPRLRWATHWFVGLGAGLVCRRRRVTDSRAEPEQQWPGKEQPQTPLPPLIKTPPKSTNFHPAIKLGCQQVSYSDGLRFVPWFVRGEKREGWGDVNFVSGAMIRNVSGRHLNGKANCWRQAIWWIETKISERW